jgi:hypothetical protein
MIESREAVTVLGRRAGHVLGRSGEQVGLWVSDYGSNMSMLLLTLGFQSRGVRMQLSHHCTLCRV